jgi:16S rRNA (cytosine967-C5)-methyltransferase
VGALVLTGLCLLRAGRETGDAPQHTGDTRPRYPAHTVVDQCVRAAKHRAAAQAKLVNAVLRRYLREADAVEAALRDDPVARWNHPAWWIERLRQDWPQQWQDILEADNRRAPLTLRINARWGRAEDYLRHLDAAGLSARATGAHTVVLAASVPVARLPGFDMGWCSVQDEHAQRAAPLLLGDGLPAGARVLDACCAPGGKTAHLLELADVDLLALDVDERRLRLVQDNLRRLRLQARLQAADARRVDAWWDGQPFDAILLDAPCSASGIVRRHPDVRWLRRQTDLDALAATQDELLRALWPLLKPGGRLLYCTCSVFRQEGSAQIDAFLQRTPDLIGVTGPGHMLPVADNGRLGSAGPPASTPQDAAGEGDGFYYALLVKRQGLFASPQTS